MNITTIVALILIFLGGVGAILLVIGQSASSKADKSEIISTTRDENKQLKNELSEIKKERDILNKALEDRDRRIQDQTKNIIDLGEQTADLSKKLSETAKNIYDVSKATKFSMPNSVTVTYSIFFQLEAKSQHKADSILNESYKHDSPGAYSSVDYKLIKDILEWDERISDWITIAFASDYKISTTEVSYTSLLSFSNSESLYKYGNSFSGIHKTLLYNYTEKKFLIEIADIQLVKQVLPTLSLNPNLANTSIFDLAKSTMILTQSLPDKLKAIEISNFKISSPELNLYFLELKNSDSKSTFFSDVKFEERKN